MSRDSIEALLRDMRDTAEWRWQGYDNAPGCGYHDDALNEFADRLEKLLGGKPCES